MTSPNSKINGSAFSTFTLLVDSLNATASSATTRTASPTPEQTGTSSSRPSTGSRSRPSSNPGSRKDSPRPLPKAPLSQDVAQRILRNSSRVAVQRFDSAEYFLSLHKEQQKRQSEQSEEADAPEAVDQPLAPPLIDNRRRLSSPLKERQRTSSPIAFDGESR